MSPEQASGAVSDARSDVWALGVVLYEMLSGRRPFEGDTAESLTTAILEREPPSLSTVDPQTPPALEHVVQRCLAKDAANRWQSARDVATELGWISEGRAAAAAAPPTRRRVWLLGGMALLTVAVGMAGGWWWRARSTRAVLDPRRVVVAVFENRTGDSSLDALGKIAADYISEGLAHLQDVQVVPSSTVLLAAGSGGTSATDPLAELARATGAGLIVSGSYYLEGRDVRIRARLTDATSGQLTSFEPALGARNSPMAAVDAMRQQVMGAVALRFDTTWTALAGETVPTYEAYQEYLAGVERTQHDWAAAATHFARVLELQPDFVPARLWLVGLDVNRGDRPEAARHLAVLEDGRARLTRFQQLKVAARSAQLAGKIEESYVAAREARLLVPHDAREAFFFAYLAGNANHHREAVEALSAPLDWTSFHEQSGVSSAMYFWNLSESLHLLGEHEREVSEMRRGQAMHPQDVGLRTAEVFALVALGRLDDSDRVVDEGMALASGVAGHVYLLFGTTVELRLHGHQDASTRMAGRALEWLRSRPPEEFDTKHAKFLRAWALCVAERWDEARRAYQQLAQQEPGEIRWLGALGFLAARRGDRGEALRISEQLRVAKGAYLLGQNTRWRAGIAAWLGEKDRAVELLRAAFAEGVWHDRAVHQDLDLAPLRGYPPFEELIRAR
jgi:TolB-like protein